MSENKVKDAMAGAILTEAKGLAGKGQQTANNEAVVVTKGFAGKSAGASGGKFERRAPRERVHDDGFERKLVAVNRVTKVVKGGKNMRFNALVVVGDKNGKVGIGMGKALEVPQAVEKAVAAAKNNLITVNLDEHTIPHMVIGKFSASTVVMIPAKEGTGVIAGASARSVTELAGIKNITCKSYGSRNKTNTVKATFEGLKLLKNKQEYANIRGKKLEEILG